MFSLGRFVEKPQQVNLILFGHCFGDSLSGKTPQHRNAMIGISANLSGLKVLGWSMGEVPPNVHELLRFMVRLNPVKSSFKIHGRANYLDFRISTPSTV